MIVNISRDGRRDDYERDKRKLTAEELKTMFNISGEYGEKIKIYVKNAERALRLAHKARSRCPPDRELCHKLIGTYLEFSARIPLDEVHSLEKLARKEI